MSEVVNKDWLKSIIKSFDISFSNEAQFQFELAWQIRKKLETENVSLEKNERVVVLEEMLNEDVKEYTDIVIYLNNEEIIPIELKFKTEKQSAVDCGCYDFCKDISRIEKLIGDKNTNINKGYAIIMTNYSLYWKGPRKGSLYEEFTIKDETIISCGEHKWGHNDDVDVNKKTGGRADKIELNSDYALEWFDVKEDKENKETKCLIVEINNIKN